MKAKLNCILLVDDDEPTNFLNKMAVEELTCTNHIKIIPGAREALDYLACSGQPAPLNRDCPSPEIIFLDINMPAMDGWEFLEQYRQLKKERRNQVIVVMLTTSLFQEDMIRAQGIPEITAFENKPLTPEKLKKILMSHFDNLKVEQ